MKREELIEIGNRIQQKRLDEHIDAETMALYAGIDKSTLSRIENGHVACNSLVLKRIAEYLDVPTDYFLFGEQSKYIINDELDFFLKKMDYKQQKALAVFIRQMPVIIGDH